MGDSGVSIPPWSVIFGLLLVPTGVFFCERVRAKKEHVVCCYWGCL